MNKKVILGVFLFVTVGIAFLFLPVGKWIESLRHTIEALGWIGPIVFGLVAQLTNSYRPAILALIFFFIVGSLILFFTDTKKAIHESGNLTPEEAGAK